MADDITDRCLQIYLGHCIPAQQVQNQAQPQELHPQQVDTSAQTNKKQTSVPQELIDSYLDQSKHPVSVLMEYAAALHVTAKFEEVAAAEESQTGKFAFVCKVEGKLYPQVNTF